MKLWSGRFVESTDVLADKFNASLPFDKRLYRQDIQGSIAHSTMLCKCGILNKAECKSICDTLKTIENEIESSALEICDAEDIHSFIEGELTKRIGDTGKKLHTARSRNDQVATDLRLYMRESNDHICELLKKLCITMCDIAISHVDTLMPAYTHMQKAQPSTLAHHFMAYAQMFKRDYERFVQCRARINVMPLGSCACVATSFPIDREYTAKLLGFDAVTENSIDAVSDRDFVIEFLSNCAIVAMHLSRFNEELIYWSGEEFGFVTLPDAFSTGSSIMPQKKNPDMCELIRGKSGRVYGDLMAALTMMKGLPLAYNKDLQEDKEVVFDADDTITMCLTLFNEMIKKFTFNVDAMANAAGGGYSAATDCADYLSKHGVPFRDAHKITGAVVRYCVDSKKTLDELTLSEWQVFSPVFEKDIMQVVDTKNIVAARKIVGGCERNTELQSIEKLKAYFS